MILEFWNWEIGKLRILFKPQIRRFLLKKFANLWLSFFNFPISQFQNLPISYWVPLPCQYIILDIDPESQDHIDNYR